jgi:hypothetical protein
MHRGYLNLGSLILAAALASPLVTTGCATHAYRVYDPYDNDYQRWDHHEDVYYQQWVVETHRDRDRDRDYRHLDRDSQRQYWQWRHNHGDHDRDRDHDHDHDHDRH